MNNVLRLRKRRASSTGGPEATNSEDRTRDRFTQFLESIMNNEHPNKSLSVFEWPLKTYALVSLRQSFHPTFLKRNLTYKTRSDRRVKNSRKNFSFDKLLKRKLDENQMEINLVCLSSDTSQFPQETTNSISVEFLGLKMSENKYELVKKVDSDSLVLRNLQAARQVKFNFSHSALWPDDLGCLFNPFEYISFKVNLRINNVTYDTVFSSSVLIKDFQKPSQAAKSRRLYVLEFVDRGSRSIMNELKFWICRSRMLEKRVSTDQTARETDKPAWMNICYQVQDPKSLKTYRFEHRRFSERYECPFCHQKLNFDSFKQAELVVKRHLSLNHFRFDFTVIKQNQNSLRCDIRINDKFDGRVLRNTPVSAHLGRSKLYSEPVKTNTTWDQLGFYFHNSKVLKRARKASRDLDDYSDNMIACDSSKIPAPKYYSTRTYQIKLDKDIDENMSDDDTEWYLEHMKSGIYEFQDVNDGEKEFMILWNQFTLKHRLRADKQIEDACRAFIRDHCQDIIKLSVEKNFLVHLSNLCDYNLLKPSELLDLIENFNETRKIYYID